MKEKEADEDWSDYRKALFRAGLNRLVFNLSRIMYKKFDDGYEYGIPANDFCSEINQFKYWHKHIYVWYRLEGNKKIVKKIIHPDRGNVILMNHINILKNDVNKWRELIDDINNDYVIAEIELLLHRAYPFNGIERKLKDSADTIKALTPPFPTKDMIENYIVTEPNPALPTPLPPLCRLPD